MAIVKAFIRTSQTTKAVAVRFRFIAGRGSQFYYTSEVMVMPLQWDDKKEQLKSKIAISEEERYKINNAISEIKSQMMAYYLSLGPGQQPTAEGFTSYLHPKYVEADTKQVGVLFEQFLEDKRYSYQRKRNMRVLLCDIVRYERYVTAVSGKAYTFNVETFTANDLRSFERFIEDEWKIATIYPELYVRENKKDKKDKKNKGPQQRGRNTIITIMTHLRTFFNWMKKQEIILSSPFERYSLDDCIYGSPIYISKEELHQLKNTDLSKRPQLEAQRDIFVFQACIGCRVSDLFNFTRRNVTNDAIEYIARKTKEERPVTVRVPLNSMAKEILERYTTDDMNAPLLPFISAQKYNQAIKRAFKVAGLTRSVTRLNSQTREPEQVPLHEVASSHMARKIFIGNIFKKVKDQSLVSELTGHAPNSKAFSRYRNIDDDMKRDMVALLEG